MLYVRFNLMATNLDRSIFCLQQHTISKCTFNNILREITLEYSCNIVRVLHISPGPTLMHLSKLCNSEYASKSLFIDSYIVYQN